MLRKQLLRCGPGSAAELPAAAAPAAAQQGSAGARADATAGAISCQTPGRAALGADGAGPGKGTPATVPMVGRRPAQQTRCVLQPDGQLGCSPVQQPFLNCCLHSGRRFAQERSATTGGGKAAGQRRRFMTPRPAANGAGLQARLRGESPADGPSRLRQDAAHKPAVQLHSLQGRLVKEVLSLLAEERSKGAPGAAAPAAEQVGAGDAPLGTAQDAARSSAGAGRPAAAWPPLPVHSQLCGAHLVPNDLPGRGPSPGSPAAGTDQTSGGAPDAAAPAQQPRPAHVGWEALRGELLAAGANPTYACGAWVENHYRWAVWKLARLELLHSAPGGDGGRGVRGRLLTAAVVLDELRYRCGLGLRIGPGAEVLGQYSGCCMCCAQRTAGLHTLVAAGLAGMSASSTAATARCSRRCSTRMRCPRRPWCWRWRRCWPPPPPRLASSSSSSSSSSWRGAAALGPRAATPLRARCRWAGGSPRRWQRHRLGSGCRAGLRNAHRLPHSCDSPPAPAAARADRRLVLCEGAVRRAAGAAGQGREDQARSVPSSPAEAACAALLRGKKVAGTAGQWP